MSDKQKDFVLGSDITPQAAARSRKETVVVSVRLPSDEFARVERTSRLQGRTVSQIAREAINAYVDAQARNQACIKVSIAGFFDVGWGEEDQANWAMGKDVACELGGELEGFALAG